MVEIGRYVYYFVVDEIEIPEANYKQQIYIGSQYCPL